MRQKLVIIGFLAAALAAACTLSPSDTGKEFMFALPPVKTAEHVPLGESLIVNLPTTSPQLDTYRIALIHDKKRWDYYAHARWAEFLPSLVQDSLTKTLQDAKLFRTVATDESGLNGTLILKTEIESFHAEYDPATPAPTIKIRMFARLFDRFNGSLLLSFDIRAQQKAAGTSLADVQAAFAAAFGEAERKLAYNLRQNPKKQG